MSPEGASPPPNQRDAQRPRLPRTDQRWPRWAVWAVIGLVLSLFVLSPYFGSAESRKITYSEFLEKVTADRVESVKIDNQGSDIAIIDRAGRRFTADGPREIPETDYLLLKQHGVHYDFTTSQPNFFLSLIPYLLPMVLIIGFFMWMSRRQAGQVGSIMQIGRSKAKTYSTEKPGTTFADVAGYDGVKKEITEVVDFLKTPARFAAIGARIPKGVLLVGPPGTGKTLIARAVAGEAGVPFLSVTGSDFMEMFVGVGASRVRDLFQNARKLGRPSSSSTRSTRSGASAVPAWAAGTTSGSRRSTSCCRRWTASRPRRASW